MPITTDNEKAASINFEDDFTDGMPFAPGTISDEEQVQLLWGYPGILWEEGAAPPADPSNFRFTRYIQER